MNENREEIKKKLPSDHKMTDVAKKAGELWKALPEAEKKPYEDKYLQKNSEYKAAMEEYIKTKPAAPVTEKEDVTPSKKKARTGEKASPPATSAPKSTRGRKSAGGKKAVEAAPVSEDLAEALKQAAELGFEDALKNLAARPDVVSRGLSAEKILAALKNSGGLVNKAKAELFA